MTFNQFCTQEFVPFDVLPIFRFWLGSTSGCTLPGGEWTKLWREFVSEMIGKSDNGKY